MDIFEPSTATCKEPQSKLTTQCKIRKPRECLSESLQQNGEQVEQQQQQITMTQTTNSTISTTAEMMGNTKVVPNANINVNVKSSNQTTTTGNKYLPTQLTEVSTKRVLKACTTLYSHQHHNNNNNNLYGRATIAAEEDNKQLKGLPTTLKNKHLSRVSAKLRAEFFATNLDKKTHTKYSDCIYFPKVHDLVQKFEGAKQPASKTIKPKVNMIVNNTEPTTVFSLKPEQKQQHRHSPISDEGCNLTQSPYCSSDEDNDSICTASTAIEQPLATLMHIKHKEKVTRSASSDSALGLEVDENVATPPAEFQANKRRMTLTVTDLPLRPALLPLAEPTALPDSPTPVDLRQSLQTLAAQSAVPTKVLLEERVVELPADDPINSRTCSRRESAQSSISDYPPSECSGVRYMRTPSVVVSDYSDEVMCGITLEEIEYFRAQRSGRRFSSLDTSGNEKDGEGNSDISAASSCSNLYYCGSTISALDGAECYVNGVRIPLERKSSDSSDYSGLCEYPEQTSTQDINLSNLLAAQHLDNKPANIKKVGLTPKVVISDVDN